MSYVMFVIMEYFVALKIDDEEVRKFSWKDVHGIFLWEKKQATKAMYKWPNGCLRKELYVCAYIEKLWKNMHQNVY